MATSSTNGSSAAPIRVLLVDDHEDTNRSLMLLLRRRGYAVQTAVSIAAAIAAAAEQPCDVLVSDLGLPDGNGLDLLARLPAPPKLGGIMLTGFSMEEDIERSKAAGYKEHLSKPISVDKLDAVIRRLAAQNG